MKSILLKSPEFYLLLIILLAAYTPPLEFNTLFLVLALIPLSQIIFKKRLSGLIIGASFLIMNLFFLGALLSEFSEFPEFTEQAQKLIFVGLGIFLLNLLMGVLMVIKYGSLSPNRVRA